MRKLLVVAALLLQFAVVATAPALANGAPEPACLPCPAP